MEHQYGSICEEIKRILPSLEEATVVSLMDKLVSLGVESVADLMLLQEKDLEGVLKPIQIRKILSNCDNRSNEQALASDCHSSPLYLPDMPSPSFSEMSSISSCPSPIMFEKPANTDPNWAYKIEMPWSKIGKDVKEPLQAGKRLSPPVRRKLVRFIVDEIREKTSHATRRQFSIIAKKIVQTFADSLQDKMDDCLIGTGYDSFLKQLLNRNDNLNRALTETKTLPTFNAVGTEGRKEVQPKKSDAYGCINFAPNISNDEVNSLEQTRETMCNQSGSLELDWELCERELIETYSLQRKDINTGVNTRDMKVRWPLLFTEKGLRIHFKLLVGIDIKETINEAVLHKIPRLSKFFEAEGPQIAAIIKQTKLDITDDNRMALLPANILATMKLFTEEENSLFWIADETSTDIEIEAMDKKGWPRVVCLGSSIMAAKEYMIVVDGCVAVRNLGGFLSALTTLFAIFYVLNIHYQEEAMATLEFIQRCFVGLNPDRGSKTDRKRKATSGGGVNAKVLRLINKISNYEWI